MSLFTDDEIEALKESWKLIIAGGRAAAGLLILQKLFNDVPASRGLFSRVGVEQEGVYSLERMQSNSHLVTHAHRLASRLNNIVENLKDTGKVVDLSCQIGRIHAKYGVMEEHFDILGTILVSVLCSALVMEVSHPTIQAWIKAYGAISQTAKAALVEENIRIKTNV